MIVAMKNKYIYRSRISEKKFREILKFFCLDLEAVKVAEICNISLAKINLNRYSHLTTPCFSLFRKTRF